MKKGLQILLSLGLLMLVSLKAFSTPLVINAGTSDTVCSGDSVTLGGSPIASGGTAPYTFQWAPAGGMNNPADSNPHVKVNVTTTFTLTVLDAVGNRQIDSVTVVVDNVVNVTAGANATICMYLDSAAVGSAANPPAFTYAWSPPAGLDCPTCPSTFAKPPVTTTYTLTASDPARGCTKISTVTITVTPPPVVTTTSPVTINRGQSVKLNVTGLTNSFQWLPDSNLTDFTTATPIASPNVTTTYTVFGKAADGCFGIDSVTVDVLQDSILYFYNTFTPNGDGINDTWYIGNINLFPNNEVLIFNRYGAQIYDAHGYANQWDGTNLGTPVPDATYYYVVYTGNGQTYRGSVTIIRKVN